MPTEEHHHHGPVIHGGVHNSQLAWNNRNVTQNFAHTEQVAPGFEEVAQVVAKVKRQLNDLGLPDADARDAGENADAVLAEVVKPKPDRGIVRTCLTALKKVLDPLALGLLTGAREGAVATGKSLVHALTQLSF
ncbi:hypothetical protein [Amycolatopsis echigonensis]|uniref:Uncharacterized protein n=1 Tax=Amycolatopsis echigonensis TaxID=2576905 RepID=A0A8E1VUU3_9PSEU|nr:hypothetical protein [Amycolatopsis echigonensis]MBB2498688.1 hypothetical protein [Amycolatopsis echigonensis]